MKYTNIGMKTFIIPILVCLSLFFLNSCGSSKVAKTYDTVEDSEKALAKKRKKERKLALKEAKAVNKRHWDNQTKAAKKSIKKNKKRMKKNKKKGRFVP
jgi:predicted Rossmann fold nucleotide-binding protein DprA/Smf involved in DNA uptake